MISSAASSSGSTIRATFSIRSTPTRPSPEAYRKDDNETRSLGAASGACVNGRVEAARRRARRRGDKRLELRAARRHVQDEPDAVLVLPCDQRHRPPPAQLGEQGRIHVLRRKAKRPVAEVRQ